LFLFFLCVCCLFFEVRLRGTPARNSFTTYHTGWIFQIFSI
jgi:hypothetical protein